MARKSGKTAFSLDNLVRREKRMNEPKTMRGGGGLPLQTRFSVGHDLMFSRSTWRLRQFYSETAIFKSLPHEADCIILDGYPLSIDRIKQRLTAKLIAEDFNVWNLTRIFI